ncbi:ABC transporter permease [Elioraea sp.]|uniref:ABC transporter permease n=1 Tax=Elioraea sp. TaxID=2185103 RepID=UPI003F6FEA6C
MAAHSTSGAAPLTSGPVPIVPTDDPRLDPARVLARGPGAHAMRRILGHGGFMLAGIIFGLIVLMAVFAPVLAPHDPYIQDIGNRLIPPVWHDEGSWTNPFGTDAMGRDYLSRVIYGARISLIIGVATAIISGIIGSALGITAGYFGGRIDMVISLIITTRLSLPVILVALAVVAIIGASLHIVIAVLGLLLWDRFAVVMRSATMQARSLDYVAAASAIGASTPRIIVSEILPNIMNNLIVVATFEVANAILLEAALSFLGLGVQPPTPSWGLMIAEGRDYLLFDPWVIVIPGIALSLLVLSVNMLGDGLRDITAPENCN